MKQFSSSGHQRIVSLALDCNNEMKQFSSTEHQHIVSLVLGGCAYSYIFRNTFQMHTYMPFPEKCGNEINLVQCQPRLPTGKASHGQTGVLHYTGQDSTVNPMQ
jgi:hypothetical protein